MRRNSIKIISMICLLIFTFFATNDYAIGSNQKTLIIVLDELDFKIAERITNHNMSIGLMSMKSAGLYGTSSEESTFMTIAAGRRVKVNEGLFKGVKETDIHSIIVDGYENITRDFNKRYSNFSQEINLLGDNLTKNGVRTGFLGEGSSSLIVADKKGIINKGINEIKYSEEWIKSNTNDLFESIDVLVVSYKIDGLKSRIDLLNKYIEEFSDISVYIFPKDVSGDMSYKWNETLVPLIYNNISTDTGTIVSSTTKREGLVSSLDIKVDIEHSYGINVEGSIGSRVNIVKKNDVFQEIKNNLLEFLNLNIIKYVFHGYVIIAQLYVLYDFFIRKKREERNIRKYNIIMTSILLCILLSLIYGVLGIQRYILFYCISVIIISLILSKILVNRVVKPVKTISILTNVLILYGVFFNLDMIYNSFIGYNNIVAAGRFYGLNNEIMGVLIVTSIATFFELKKIASKHVSPALTLIYFPIVIIALSGRYGANTGGFLTSIVLFLMLIYTTLFHDKKNKKTIWLLIGIGIAILGLNLFIDINSTSSSHAGSLIERIRVFGFYELVDMVIIKLRQLLLMTIIPPWSIIFISQIFFARRFFKARNIVIKDKNEMSFYLYKEYCIIFIVSIIAFIINDTGTVAFTYINTYLIASIFDTDGVKILLDGDN